VSPLRSAAIAAAGLIAAMSTQAAPILGPSITVTPWLAPNAFGSPSYAGAQANAISGMLAGGATTGSGPQQFAPQVGPVDAAEAIVTGFASWRGQVNPGVNVGAAYAAELGNRMTFALLITGGGERFSISQLGFSATSSDAGNLLGFSFATGSYNYSAGYVGIQYGLDGALGGGDDIYVTGGPNTELVDALVGRGSGNSFAAYCPPAPAVCDEAAQIASIAAAASAFGPGSTTFTGTYTLAAGNGPVTGAGSFEIVTAAAQAVPEPSSILLAGLSLAALGFTRRRGAR
jgi:hypothetical protein